MEVKTEFNIGDMIEYKRLVEFGDKKKNHYVNAIGIIRSIAIHTDGLSYFLESGYHGGAIREANVLSRLERYVP